MAVIPNEGSRTRRGEVRAACYYNSLYAALESFRRDGTIREKYNVVTRSSETKVESGYHQNVIGFGWTNGAFLVLLHALRQAMAARLAAN